MFAILYECSLFLLFLISLPKVLYMRLIYKKYAKNFFQRFGGSFPSIDKKGRYLIWVHAVSLGEAKVASTIIKNLKEEINNPLILISTITETGQEEAKKSIPEADYYVYLPFDFFWIIKPIVKKIQPNLVIICETDLWYNFLKSAKEIKAFVVVVNGKISERSQQRLSKFSGVAKHFLAPIDFFCVQNRHYQKRFLQVGVPQSKMVVTGNIKFDGITPALSSLDLNKFRTQLSVRTDGLLLVVGSTHDPEEKIMLTIFQKIESKFPTLKMIIVPRHPERFNSVATLIEESQIPYQRYTSFDEKKEFKIILIDAMGILRECYQVATIAIVGGSFTSKVGGHNILEPSGYGVPVLFGPYMHQQSELVHLMLEYQCGSQVSEQTLASELESLLLNSEKRKAQGIAGLKMMTELKGATSKTWEAIKKFVPTDTLKSILM